MFDWISLYALLQNYVIVTYRRYYDWLPSVKQKIEQWMDKKPVMNRWPQYDDSNHTTSLLFNQILTTSNKTTNK
jgi:hypothetical protein